MSLRNDVDIIYHASFIDEEGLDMLEAKKDEVFVAPGLNWLVATLNDAASFGYPPEAAEAAGYRPTRARHRRPAGDAGGAAPRPARRRLRLRLDPARHLRPRPTALRRTPRLHPDADTAGRDQAGGEIMRMPDELGQIKPGFYADLILVDGDPLKDITVLQDHTKIVGIMKGGALPQGPRHPDSQTRARRTCSKPTAAPRSPPDEPHPSVGADSDTMNSRPSPHRRAVGSRGSVTGPCRESAGRPTPKFDSDCLAW